MLDKWGIVNQTNSKQTGIPTSKQGIEREIGSVILKKLNANLMGVVAGDMISSVYECFPTKERFRSNLRWKYYYVGKVSEPSS